MIIGGYLNTFYKIVVVSIDDPCLNHDYMGDYQVVIFEFYYSFYIY